MKQIPLAIVAAIGSNGAIGYRNKLPWSMPTDLAHFRTHTMGKPMIMGRRTFDAIGRVLPGRESIVVSGFDLDLPKGAMRAASPEEALTLARSRAVAMGALEVALIGGAVLFDDLLSEAERMYLTHIDLAPKADAFFPAIDKAAWREVARTAPPLGPRDDASCTFVNYLRVR